MNMLNNTDIILLFFINNHKYGCKFSDYFRCFSKKSRAAEKYDSRFAQSSR